MTLNVNRLAQEMKDWFEGGFCQRELEPSLLGLDWSSFGTRKFSDYGNETKFLNPPEFIYYGFSALDAYATAMLAARFSFAFLGVLTFRCRLTQCNPEGRLRMEFTTIPESGRIDSDQIMLELLRSFPELLRAKEFKDSTILFLEGEGCPMDCEYPGRMISSASQFLRDRPVDLWPQAILNLTPTVELRTRAQEVLDFLRSSPQCEGGLN